MKNTNNTTNPWLKAGFTFLASACVTFADPGPQENFTFGPRSYAAVRHGEPGTSETPATNRVKITVEGQYRVIRANGIPDHKPGAFPNANNPNTISAQNYTFLIPSQPKAASKPTRLGMHPFGVALNGVVFDPAAAEWWERNPRSGWQYEPMHMEGKLGADQHNAHVQPTGAYHYHSVPIGLLDKLSQEHPAVTLIGWAADGFPIYSRWGYSDAVNGKGPLKKIKPSFQLKKGERPTNPGPGGKYDGTFVADYEYVPDSGDLDECNGRFGPTPEFPNGIYHYFVTDGFPFIPRQFKGTPDPSFFRQGPPPGGGFGHPPGRGGPRQGPPPGRG